MSSTTSDIAELKRREELKNAKDYVAVVNNDNDKKEYSITLLQASTQKPIATLRGHTSCVYVCRL